MDTLAEVIEVTALVLQRSDLDPSCDFLALGVSSLALMRIAAILEDRFAVPIPLEDLLGGADAG